MKFLFHIVIPAFLLSFGSSFCAVGEETHRQQDQTLLPVDGKVPVQVLSDPSNNLETPANKENHSRWNPTIDLSSFRCPFAGIFNSDSFELNNRSSISKYLFAAKYRIARFEGPDIIYPFHYFW